MTDRDPLWAQHRLQIGAYHKDPLCYTPEQKAQSFIENFTSLVTELGEASEEIGWKPWATSRHLNRDEYIGELVDVFHFFLNLLLLAPDITWDEFLDKYFEKCSVNLERQQKGYDGVSSKCPYCGRDVPTTPAGHIVRNRDYIKGQVTLYCLSHHREFQMQEKDLSE